MLNGVKERINETADDECAHGRRTAQTGEGATSATASTRLRLPYLAAQACELSPQ